jgi:hypothetical protein
MLDYVNPKNIRLADPIQTRQIAGGRKGLISRERTIIRQRIEQLGTLHARITVTYPAEYGDVSRSFHGRT